MTLPRDVDVLARKFTGASIICSIDKNSPVSFVEDSQNGYSKVVYNGVTGYALSSYLTKQEPVPEYANENTTSVNDVQGNDYVNHSPNVLFNEVCMPYGAAAFVNCAVKWLKNNK